MIEKITDFIDLINEKLGRLVAWATLLLVLVQFAIVIGHYIFREGSIFMQESLLYLHSLIFLGAAGYTLKHNGHVRVDVFYGNFSERTKAWINLLGTLLLLLPVTGVIGWYSWPFIADSWAALEGSIEASGIQAVYLLKSLILVFVVFILLQGLSLILHSLRIIRGAEHLVEEKPEGV